MEEFSKRFKDFLKELKFPAINVETSVGFSDKVPGTIDLTFPQVEVVNFGFDINPISCIKDGIIFKRKRNKITAKYINSGIVISHASAICHKDDTFDEMFGRTLALLRLMGVEENIINAYIDTISRD